MWMPMNSNGVRSILSAIVLGVTSVYSGGATAETPSVVASIKPVYSLVAAIMDGVGDPHLIVQGVESPHTFSLKPSRARTIADADVIIWIGPELEPALGKPIRSLGAGAAVVELATVNGLTRLPFRAGGAFEDHEKDDDHRKGQEHDDGHGHNEHGHNEHGHDEHDHNEHGHDEHDHDEHDHDEHDHEGTDPHLWLDPMNAALFAGAIAEALITADPGNATRYRSNADRLSSEISELSERVSTRMAPLKERPFIVFHDAYRYFEDRFGLAAAGSFTINPEIRPGARRLRELRHKIEELGAVCVFAEPQFSRKLLTVATDGTRARIGLLDPLGSNIADGPDLYVTLIQRMAESFESCLGVPAK